jgi:adhesin HecA-like repeat protein
VAGTLSTTGAATLNSATVTNALGAGATTVSSLTTSGDLLMTEDAAVLTHSAASGTSLAISSTNGYVSIAGSYVDVESVRITDAKIGVSGDPDLITLTSGDVAVAGTLSTTGAATLNSATVTNALGAGATTVSSLTTSGDLLMTEDAAVLTHSAASGTSLAISSTNGYVSIAGSYVDVESVRITDAKIGVSSDDDLITLTSGCGDCCGQGAHDDVGDDGSCDSELGDGDECAGGRGDDREQPDDVGRPADDGGCGGADALGGLGDVAGDLQHERVCVHWWIVR